MQTGSRGWSHPVDHFPECGKPIDLDVGAGLSLSSTDVPAHLVHLIALVNKWSFAHLYDQDIFVSLMKKHRPEEVAQLNAAFDHETRSHIRQWSASLPFDKHVSEFTPDDWAHPYWSFLHVIKLLECTGGPRDAAGAEAARQRHQQQIRRMRYAEATNQADVAFRETRYSDFINLLAEFDDLLTEIQRKKMRLAKRKLTS